MKQYRPPAPLIHVHLNGDTTYQVCEIAEGGIGRHSAIGPKYPSPGKGAYVLANAIEERRRNPVSPLRVEASPLDAKQSPPPASVLASNEAASA